MRGSGAIRWESASARHTGDIGNGAGRQRGRPDNTGASAPWPRRGGVARGPPGHSPGFSQEDRLYTPRGTVSR